MVRRDKARFSSGCESRPGRFRFHPVAVGTIEEVTNRSKLSMSKGRYSGSASRQAVMMPEWAQVNAEQAPKGPTLEAEPACRGRRPHDPSQRG